MRGVWARGSVNSVKDPPRTGTGRRSLAGGGVAVGAGAYLIWGMFPAFFGLLDFAGPVEILAQRILWTLVVVIVLGIRGDAAFGHGVGHTGLLIASGSVTLIPLLLFALAAGRVPLSTMGMLQYLTPAMQLAWGVLVGHEPMPASRWIGFALIWAALAVFTTDALRRARRPARTTVPDPARDQGDTAMPSDCAARNFGAGSP